MHYKNVFFLNYNIKGRLVGKKKWK